jgi:folate/biopterin transporter
VSSGCIAFSDVVADGIVVQRTRESDDPKVAGGLQSLCWGSASIGALISAYFSGSLLEVMSTRDVFAITAALPLLVASIAFFINEEPIQKNDKNSIDGDNSISGADDTAIEFQSEASDTLSAMSAPTNSNNESAMGEVVGVAVPNVQQQVEALWQAIKLPAVWKPALFLFLWQSTPTSEGAFLYFMTNDLGMGPEFLGRARLVTAAASLVGVWGYQKYLRTVPIKKILLWTSIASAPLGLIQLLLITHVNRDLGIPDGAFVLGDDVVLAMLGEFAFLPTLVLAAKICPPGIEAVLFATLMSIFNGASTVGTEVGAVLTKVLGVTESNFDNLALLNVICNVSSLYPLVFIGLLDGIGTKSESEMEEETESLS